MARLVHSEGWRGYMAWSLFGSGASKYKKLNPAGYEMFTSVFGQHIKTLYGADVDKFLSSISEVIDEDYEKTYSAARRGAQVSVLGMNISQQLSTFLFEHRKNSQVIDMRDGTTLYVSGAQTAFQQIARILFGWAPAISKAFGNNVMSVAYLLMKSTSDLTPDDSLYESEDRHMVKVNEGFNESYGLCRTYCEMKYNL